MQLDEAITIYLAIKIPNLSQTKWNKLMFFIDGVGFCNEDKTYSDYEYIKLPYGPVPYDYKSKIEEMIREEYLKKDRYIGIADAVTFIEANDRYINNKELYLNKIKEEETRELLEVLDQIVGIFKNWTASKMSDFTHQLDAWKKPKLREKIELALLKDDPFLQKNFDEANFAKVVMAPLQDGGVN